MDHCLQVTHHCAPDDPGRGAKCNLEICGRVPFKAGHKQLLRQYVHNFSTDSFHIVLTGWGISAGPREQHSTLLQLPEGPGKVIWGYPNRLGKRRTRETEAPNDR